MNRTLTTMMLAALAATVPAGAAPTADATTQESFRIMFESFEWPSVIFADLRLDREQTVEPSAEPPQIFPIVIDPNDPPEVPLTVSSERITVSGWVQLCNYELGYCLADSVSSLPLATGAASFEDLPMPGNTIQAEFEMDLMDPYINGVQTVSISFEASKPTATHTSVNMPSDPNAWTYGGAVHANASVRPLTMTRSGYDIQGQATSTFGGPFDLENNAAIYDASYSRSAAAVAAVDAP